VTGMLVFLKGVWGTHMDTTKFNKFFNDGAIDRATDSWWDKESKTVVTRADAEMEKLSNQDDDYNFPEMKIEVELPKAKPTGKASKADDGLSTGSYSTFRTTATQKQQQKTSIREESPNCDSHYRNDNNDRPTVGHHDEHALRAIICPIGRISCGGHTGQPSIE